MFRSGVIRVLAFLRRAFSFFLVRQNLSDDDSVENIPAVYFDCFRVF